MKTKKISKLRLILLLILLIIFCFSAYMVFSQLIREQKEDDAFADLIDQVEKDREAAQTSKKDDVAAPPVKDPQDPDQNQNQGQEEPEMLAAYAALFELNPDFFGWIEIEGTKVNYPVMYTPDDYEHYLHRAFDGSYSNSGVPFVDGRWFEGCGIYPVYGHHMKNGSMFASITSYSHKSYWQEHPIIRFDTLYEEGTYEVIAAFYSKVYSANETDAFRYYNYIDLRDPEVFAEFIKQVKDAAKYETGIDAEYGDQLLMLSTCEYHTDDGRFVVVAKKISDGE